MTNPLPINPTSCWLQHVRRGASTDDGAAPLGRVWFVRDDRAGGQDGINGIAGWHEAECTTVLSDDGTFALTLPNAAGADGVLHRRRFRCLTDPAYEPGEEWIEVWSDTDAEHPLFVGTPVSYTKTRAAITLRGRDLGAVLDRALSSDVDVWDAAAPADVIRHYSRLPVLVYGNDTLTLPMTSQTFPLPWPWSIRLDGEVAVDAFEIEARARITDPVTPGTQAQALWVGVGDEPSGASLNALVNFATGVVDIQHTAGFVRATTGTWKGRCAVTVPGPLAVRLVVRHEQVYVWVNGTLAAEGRIDRRASWPTWTFASVSLVRTPIDPLVSGILDSVHVESLAPFATRGPSATIARRLPGIPPATGLRGQYWSTAHLNSTTDSDDRVRRLWPVGSESEPVERVDPTVNFPVGTPNWPPNMPGAWTARWSGAIYLDLARADRAVRISGLDTSQDAGGRPQPLRVYIGRTRRGEETIARWWAIDRERATTFATGGLRDWIGEQRSGWYPIVIEFNAASLIAGLVLEDAELDARGAPVAWAVVPTTRLSPLGVFGEHVRMEQHRTVIGEVAAAFGYQWRVEPRGLESGEFPGQLVADDLIGLQTDLAITDEDVGEDAEVRGDAADVVDQMLADGAGVADETSTSQLTVRGIDYARAGDHLALRGAYESLAEISEQPLLRTRVDSLLVLRSGPNEQVGVRPLAQPGFVERFPLTGQLARLAWRPGDAVRLQLDQLDVVDLTPRQLTTVTWTPRPDGLGIPTVGFRARPRSPRAALSRLSRVIYGPRRNYQGGIVAISGSPGNGGVFSAEAADTVSRVPLPGDPSAIVRVIAIVRFVTGTGWRLEVHGTDIGAALGSVPVAGRYDITPWIRAPAGYLQTYARLIGGDPSRSGYGLTLELWRRS